MGPAAERHLPDSRHSASGVGTTPRGLYLTLGRAVSGQHRPSTAIEFSRIEPKPALRPRGEFISAWIGDATTQTRRPFPAAGPSVTGPSVGRATHPAGRGSGGERQLPSPQAEFLAGVGQHHVEHSPTYVLQKHLDAGSRWCPRPLRRDRSRQSSSPRVRPPSRLR